MVGVPWNGVDPLNEVEQSVREFIEARGLFWFLPKIVIDSAEPRTTKTAGGEPIEVAVAEARAKSAKLDKNFVVARVVFKDREEMVRMSKRLRETKPTTGEYKHLRIFAGHARTEVTLAMSTLGLVCFLSLRDREQNSTINLLFVADCLQKAVANSDVAKPENQDRALLELKRKSEQIGERYEVSLLFWFDNASDTVAFYVLFSFFLDPL